ncbi:Vacuolar protease A [Boothiomyces macroporosus]|uniref:Vacuolar protease A n=1 Tax=Boothiomyces macroporosus TaxID=261099 RepID=A0AAD5UI60_9FUNG|nr:Vacuolar protease A [Boothiomyces macroporosus]
MQKELLISILIHMQLAQTTVQCPKVAFFNYAVPVTIGTPPQKLMLAIDSTETYGCIQTANCGSNCNINDTSIYDSTKSSTYSRQSGNYPPRVILTDDSMQGPVVSDNFQIGSTQLTGVTFKQVTPTYTRKQVSGVMGLGHSIEGSFKDFQQAMSKPIYGFSVDSSTNFANLDLGFYNKSLYQGELAFVKEIPMPISSLFNQTNVNSVVTPYALPISSFQVNGISIPNLNFTAFVHTDLSVSQFPSDIVAPIQSTFNLTLGTDGVYEAPCSLVKFLPTVVMTFNGFNATWTPQDYVYKYASSDNCFLGFTEYKDPLFKDNLILGMGMLSKYYLAFDHSNNQIGFAQTIQPAAPAQTGQLPSPTANSAFRNSVNLLLILFIILQ